MGGVVLKVTLFDIFPPCMEENIANRILRKDIENIVKKAASGKPLSNAERQRIEAAYAQKTETTRYVKNLVELAAALEISRQSIHKWRKMSGSPKPLSNGKHNVQKWREFMRENELREPDTPEEAALKARKLLAEVKQVELKLKVMEGTYVSTERVREVWMTHIGQVRSILESRFLNELPPILTTLDAIQIREKMQDVLDESYRALSLAAGDIEEPVDVD